MMPQPTSGSRAAVAPAGLLGAAALFWGWQTGHLPLAVLFAVALELPALIRWRLDIRPLDLERLTDYTLIAGVIVAVVLASDKDLAGGALVFFAWLPAILLPLPLAQRYGGLPGLDRAALSWAVRRRRRRGLLPPAGLRDIDVTYPHLGLWLLAAGTVNPQGPLFFLASAGLLAWACWPMRRPGAGLAWLLTIACAIGLGHWGHHWLFRTQNLVENWASDLISHQVFDPYFTRTAIGALGELKTSSRIQLRVYPAPGEQPPALLRRASYNRYSAQGWRATERVYRLAPQFSPEVLWFTGPSHGHWLTIEAPLRRNQTLLLLPNGALELRGKTVEKLELADDRSMMVLASGERVTYQVRYDETFGNTDLPQVDDLVVPNAERAVLQNVLSQWPDIPATQLPATLTAWFRQHFRYSTHLTSGSGTPLSAFLTQTRRGHCEYFATATVLLLRSAGVPARYSSGYALSEYSPLEGAYIARSRHSHAWAQAWLDGRWVDVDTTPPGWWDEEAENAGWQKLADWSAWLWRRWGNWQPDQRLGLAAAGLAVLALLGIIVWSIMRARHRSTAAPRRSGSVSLADSALAQALAGLGLQRGAGEPLVDWRRRLGQVWPAERVDHIIELTLQDDRQRYDPAGGTVDQHALRQLLQQLGSSPPHRH